MHHSSVIGYFYQTDNNSTSNKWMMTFFVLTLWVMPEPHMNRIIQLTFILTIGFSLTSCFGLFDSGSDRITGNYHVLWIDLQENQGISEQIEGSEGAYIGLVPEYVFEVGHDDNFIIAKQHPTSGFHSGYQINTEVTNYYIIDLNSKKDKVIGPLSLSTFEQLRKKLGISKIEFDMKYPEIP
ncbi:MAG: DUF3997 domain-containing protein [Balneolaceae bacterium]